MSSFKMSGVLKVINPSVQVSEKFIKREFVLNVPHDNYPQDVAFQLTQKNVDVLDKFSQGETVEVSFDIRGREYNGRYFNNLEAWRIEKSGDSASPSKEEEKTEEDLPF